MITRRQFLGTAAGVAGAALARRLPSATAAPLPHPQTAPFDHVVVAMMENRSFDHFLGWLPGADGRQAGLSYTDLAGKRHKTHALEPDYSGCGNGDPDHSWRGGLVQLNRGRCDGWLRTPKDRAPDDVFPIGYYSEQSVSVLGALARHYTVLDRYFSSIMAETYPNRFYLHAAATDRDENNFDDSFLPTIWDRLKEAGLTGYDYTGDLSLPLLWRAKHLSVIRPWAEFFVDAAAGQLPDVSIVDPMAVGADYGLTNDDHPFAGIQGGEAFLGQVYHAVRNSPQWDRTVLVITFDEWGGFFDHVVPPKVIDTTRRPKSWGPHPDYRQLGFRVPTVVISPFSPSRVDHRGPFEHTSILRMIEWRWGLRPLTSRDAHALNLAKVLDFSRRRTDAPGIPSPLTLRGAPCLSEINPT